MEAPKIKHVEDTDVQDIAEEAARAACTVLDEMFLGWDAGGITSDFAGHMKGVILQMLAGRSVLCNMMSAAHLPRHILTDATFGNPLVRGEQFLVVRRARLDPTSDRYETLNDTGTRFVTLSDGEHIDPFTSFDAAVKGILGYLRGVNAEGVPDDYKIMPAAFGPSGYLLNPESNQ
jgi:hypothetical protein